MRFTISSSGQILHTENIEKRFIGGIGDLMEIFSRSVNLMSPEEKSEVRSNLDRKLPS